MMPTSTRALRLPVHLVLLALLATLIPLVLTVHGRGGSAEAEHPRGSARRSRGTPPTRATPSATSSTSPERSKLADLIRATYGSDESIGIARNSCYTTSEHNDGRALDWMVDATTRGGQGEGGRLLVAGCWPPTPTATSTPWLAGSAIMYIIFNKRIWRAYGDPGWGSYSGTNPHTDHIHISLSYDGSTGRTSFWSGKPLEKPCATGVPDDVQPLGCRPTRCATSRSRRLGWPPPSPGRGCSTVPVGSSRARVAESTCRSPELVRCLARVSPRSP